MHSLSRLASLAAVCVLSIGAASAYAQVGGGGSIGAYMAPFDREQAIRLSQAPKAARDAALPELGASKVNVTSLWSRRRDEPVYKFEGRDASGIRRVVKVTGDGTVLQRR